MYKRQADDYIVKPFEPKELVARVKAVLRRYEPKQEEDKNILKFGELEINLSNYSVLYHGKSLDFPPKEFELLSFLAQHPNRVFTREQLLDASGAMNRWGTPERWMSM